MADERRPIARITHPIGFEDDPELRALHRSRERHLYHIEVHRNHIKQIEREIQRRGAELLANWRFHRQEEDGHGSS